MSNARPAVIFPSTSQYAEEESMEVQAEGAASASVRMVQSDSRPGTKYLQDLERRHHALSSVIGKLDSHTAEPSSSNRQRELLKRTLSALKDADGDSSDGKWVFLSHILHLACTASGSGGGGGYGYRWSGARPDLAPPRELFEPVTANSTPVSSPRKGTQKKAVGIEEGKRWVNARTSMQWQEFEKRFFEERRIVKKVEHWKKGLVVCGTQSLLADDSKNAEAFEESIPVSVDEVLKRAAVSGKSKEKKTKPPTVSLSKSAQDLLKDASPFGFAVVKKQRTMSTTGKPKAQATGPTQGPLPASNRDMNVGEVGNKEKGKKNTDFLDLELDGSFHFRPSQLVTSTPNPKPNTRPKSITNDPITAIPPQNSSNSNTRHFTGNNDTKGILTSTTSHPLDKSASLPVIRTTTSSNTDGNKGPNKRSFSPSQAQAADHDRNGGEPDTIERALKKARTMPPPAASPKLTEHSNELKAYLNMYYAHTHLDDGSPAKRNMHGEIVDGKLKVISPPMHEHRTLIGYAAALASAQAAAAAASKPTPAAGIVGSKEDKHNDKAGPSSPLSSPPPTSPLVQPPMFSYPTKPRKDAKMQPMTAAIPKLTDLLASARKTKEKGKGAETGRAMLGSSPVAAFRESIKGKEKARADTPMEEIVNDDADDNDVFSDNVVRRNAQSAASAAEVAGVVLPSVDLDADLDMSNFKPLATSTQHGPLGVLYESQPSGANAPFISGSMDAPPFPSVTSQPSRPAESAATMGNEAPPQTSQASIRTTASKDSWASVYAPVLAPSSTTAGAPGPEPFANGATKSKWTAPTSSNFMAPSSPSLPAGSQAIASSQQGENLPTSGYPYSPAYQYNSQLNGTVDRNVEEVSRVLDRDLNMDMGVFESVEGWLRDPYADADPDEDGPSSP